MATWTLTSTGTVAVVGSSFNLIGDLALTGARPADWNPGGVTAIRIQRNLNVSGSNDDGLFDYRAVTLMNSVNDVITTLSLGTIDYGVGGKDGDYPITLTDTALALANLLSSSGNLVRGGSNTGSGDEWARYQANMKNDDGTMTITSVTVEIDYTPAVVLESEIWNGSAWVGAEAWNGAAWVTPEVWNGSQWVPFKAP